LYWIRISFYDIELVRQFPKGHSVKLFRLVLSDKRFEVENPQALATRNKQDFRPQKDYLITHEVTQHPTQAAQEAFRPHWFFTLKIRKH
jgi:hypothetical protein